MKNKYVSFFVSSFFLVLILSTLVVSQTNMALADKPDTNVDDLIRSVIAMEKKANPYRPFSAAWPGSGGYLLEIQSNNSYITPVVYSVDELTDQYFSSFIASMINHLSSTLNGENAGQVGFEPEVKIVFVRKALIALEHAPIAVVPPSLIPEDKLSCQLESPWVKLDIQRSPVLRIHAIYFWNERQFLIDQAILSGEPVSDFSAIDSEVKELPNSGPSDHFQVVPPELLRLLRRPPFVGRPPYSELPRFSDRSADASYIMTRMNTLNDHMVKHYPKLAQTLFDQCFASEQYVLQRYKTILDVRDLIPLGEYQFKKIAKN